jgi:hypothetical protein
MKIVIQPDSLVAHENNAPILLSSGFGVVVLSWFAYNLGFNQGIIPFFILVAAIFMLLIFALFLAKSYHLVLSKTGQSIQTSRSFIGSKRTEIFDANTAAGVVAEGMYIPGINNGPLTNERLTLLFKDGSQLKVAVCMYEYFSPWHYLRKWFGEPPYLQQGAVIAQFLNVPFRDAGEALYSPVERAPSI